MKTPREILLKRHQPVESKLDQMWTEALAPSVAAVYDRRKSDQAREVGAHRAPLQLLGWKLWRELIWPCRRVWAGLGCVWVLIAVLSFASSEPASRVVSKAEPRSREEMQALIEQRRLLAQMMSQ